MATIAATLAPLAWLMLLARPAARSGLADAANRVGLAPVTFWMSISVSTFSSLVLAGFLLYSAGRTLSGRSSTDRLLFYALNAVWLYLGGAALVSMMPGFSLLYRATFLAPNFGWFVVSMTGLPFWGPLVLWFFGTAKRDPIT